MNRINLKQNLIIMMKTIMTMMKMKMKMDCKKNLKLSPLNLI